MRQRKLAYAALALAYLQVVFGGIVRITGSGMGCGDHWPKCHGYFFPPLTRPDLVVELTHRYLAVAVSLAVAALVVNAYRRSSLPAIASRGPALLALALVVAAALLGAASVKLALGTAVVVAHLTIAMTLLAALAWAVIRAGGLGATRVTPAAARTRAATLIAAAIAFATVVLGALTAHVPDAASSCGGFPHCRAVTATGIPLWIHGAHRVLAVALLFHCIGLWRGARRRRESPPVRTAVTWLVAVLVIQIAAAAAMVELQFPAIVRATHQALGALIWLTAVTAALLVRVSQRSQLPA